MPAKPVRCRVGSVSFLNARPLIYGLDDDPGVDLHLDVPSRLLDGLAAGRYDVALLPVIDYQRMPGLCIVPAGGIGCDGPTLTVRIFSTTPIGRIDALACDGDSHTSVALARILLAEQYGIRPEFVPLDRSAGCRPDIARLLIGDKVIAEAPEGFPHQLDLGEAWKRWTGLPFVFAAWMARGGVELDDICLRLERAKRVGLERVEQIIAQESGPRRWPPDVAREYLTRYLQYDITPLKLEAIRRFHHLAARHSLIDSPVRELHIHRPTPS